MGFRLPAQIEFDYMYLDDPTAVATLLMNMADRNIISDEFVQRNIKAKPSIENRRVANEGRRRQSMETEKVSPYHQVDQDHALKKIALQSGVSSPSEVGLKLDKKKSGEKSAMEMKEQQMKIGRPAGPSKTGSPGRPKNTRDTKPRKEKKFVPKNKAALEIWTKNAQRQISDIVNPQIISAFQKNDLRSLTGEQFNQLERLKFEILCNLDIGEDVSDNAIALASQSPNPSIHIDFDKWITEALNLLDKRSFSIDEIRDLRASFFVDINSEI